MYFKKEKNNAMVEEAEIFPISLIYDINLKGNMIRSKDRSNQWKE